MSSEKRNRLKSGIIRRKYFSPKREFSEKNSCYREGVQYQTRGSIFKGCTNTQKRSESRKGLAGWKNGIASEGKRKQKKDILAKEKGETWGKVDSGD